MTPEQIKSQNLFPHGFRPLPHVKHPTGGMVFPKQQIDAIQKAEARDMQRFDVDFDLPDHLTPEFPPPMFLTSRPDLGDVTQGEVLTIKNYYRLLYGKVTPVQMEGMRLLVDAVSAAAVQPDRRPQGEGCRAWASRASTAT